ncbi:Ig-like domain-containing protein [Clostridium pasteurianum]|uniref:Ig-like domain-containing surface protein n=1 Tax=Clostridium pasteurianum BC1 TaxID=86416 RepID=R4K870_CLOPA|nr:Ig domain-containing protein [Clostridium pasteurianum]AGK96719.1 Ig-like domain-containing surface protein [Clostridium pasteurianum BC1]
MKNIKKKISLLISILFIVSIFPISNFNVNQFIYDNNVYADNLPINNPTSLSLSETSDTLPVGGTDTLTALLVTPGNATNSDINNAVKWTSSNINVTTVDSTGKVTAVSAGTATITATLGNKKASCTVTVNTPVTSVTLNKTTDILTVGSTDTLTATVAPDNATNKAVTWSSSDTNVATVDNTGKVTAVDAGTATITVTTVDGSKTASCTVTVNIPVTSVTLNKATDTLTVGGTDTLTATVAPDNATNQAVTWTSSNNAIATVDATGKVTAVSAGTAAITVTTVDGSKTASCTVTVNNQNITTPTVKSISVDKSTVTSGDMITVTLNAEGSISGPITIYYDPPSGNARKVVILSKNSNGTYSGYISIGQYDAVGLWKVDGILLTDVAGNSILINNTESNPPYRTNNTTDLSSGDFTIKGTVQNITTPTVKSISVDKSTVTSGDMITVTLNAEGSISGPITIYYDPPSGNARKVVILSKNSNGTYSGYISIGQYDAVGLWKVDGILLTDVAGNSILINNTESNPPYRTNNTTDLSSGDFTVK